MVFLAQASDCMASCLLYSAADTQAKGQESFSGDAGPGLWYHLGTQPTR